CRIPRDWKSGAHPTLVIWISGPSPLTRSTLRRTMAIVRKDASEPPRKGQRPGGQKGLTPMTEVEFSRLLSELSSTANALNTSSDSINELLSRVEKQIAETNVGLDVEVYLNGGEGDHLQWKKVSKDSAPLEWGIAIDDRHVLKCSRD